MRTPDTATHGVALKGLSHPSPDRVCSMRWRVVSAIGLVMALGACSSSGSLRSDAGGSGTGSPGNGTQLAGGGSDSGGSGGGGTGGTGGGSDGGGTGGTGGAPIAAINDITGGASNIVTASGNLVGGVAFRVGGVGANTPLAPTTAALGDTLSHPALAILAVGTALDDGLGSLGTNPNALKTTVQVVQPVVGELGQTISGVGKTVATLNTPALGPVGDVAGLAGSVVGGVGQGVSQLSTTVGKVLDSAPVTQLTATGSQLVTPLLATAVGVTQTTGDVTRLGTPVNNLLQNVGGGVSQLGQSISQTPAPLAAPLGQVLSSAGSTVAAVGGLLTSGSGSGSPGTGALSTLSGLTNVLGVTNVQLGGSAGVTGVLGAPIAILGASGSVQGSVFAGGVSGGATANLTAALSPVVTLVSSLTGAVGVGGTSASGATTTTTTISGGTTAATTQPFSPLSNLLGGLLGKR